MNSEDKAMLEWCVYQSQKFPITDEEDRLYLPDLSGGNSILMTSRKSIADHSSDAYKLVSKIWKSLPDDKKAPFRELAQETDPK